MNAIEDYLKAIYHLSQEQNQVKVGNKALSELLGFKSSSISEMMGRMEEQGYITRKKYHGVKLTEKGLDKAVAIMRKHRLWELFLVEKLGFGWGEVHEIAEQMEHIDSKALVDRLDAFLGHPTVDPHGHPIPTPSGDIKRQESIRLSELKIGSSATVVGVEDDSPAFLGYLNDKDIGLGVLLSLAERKPFDGTCLVRLGGQEFTLSEKAAELILVKPKTA